MTTPTLEYRTKAERLQARDRARAHEAFHVALRLTPCSCVQPDPRLHLEGSTAFVVYEHAASCQLPYTLERHLAEVGLTLGHEESS
jgi:hypothetical protein